MLETESKFIVFFNFHKVWSRTYIVSKWRIIILYKAYKQIWKAVNSVEKIIYENVIQTILLVATETTCWFIKFFEAKMFGIKIKYWLIANIIAIFSYHRDSTQGFAREILSNIINEVEFHQVTASTVKHMSKYLDN